MHALRNILLDTELKEEFKWSQPCYTYNGKNVMMLTAFNDLCCIAFFKGALLNDSNNLLEFSGPNSQASKRLNFIKEKQVVELEPQIRDFIKQAIELEKSGASIELKKVPEPLPQELQDVFNGNPELEIAFYSLTPGRQRGYIIHFSQPKQTKTRLSRITKMIPKIMNGKGFHDR
jgi:uncharacterized protein YdeI (YjbR/CyaY-like superfamily)